MTLVSAFTTEAANQRIVSPLFCGSHPYLHGSLTYRLHIHHTPLFPLCQRNDLCIYIKI